MKKSAEDAKLSKIYTLEIDCGDMDDNDEDLLHNIRGNGRRRSSLKLIDDSITRMSLNSIGGSSRRIKVPDVN